MGRQPCCDKLGLKRGPWTIDEDHKLINFILHNGIHCWRSVPKLAGLLRCGKSCRLRWINYLRPDLKRGGFTETEEDQIIQLHALLGNKWSKIASHFPGRTDNEIKNRWNTRIKKKLKLRGLDPVTHKPIQQQADETDQRQENVAPESDMDSSSNKEKEQRTSLEKKSHSHEQDDQNAKRNEQKQEEMKLLVAETETDDLLKSYEMLDGELDLGSILEQDTNTSSSSYSSSFSLEEHSFSIQQQWFDSVDSFLPWDAFNSIQEDFFFLGNGQST